MTRSPPRRWRFRAALLLTAPLLQTLACGAPSSVVTVDSARHTSASSASSLGPANSVAPLPPGAVAVEGVARDAKGKPLGGAVVAIVPTHVASALAMTTTLADGRFHFAVQPGSYAITATSPGLSAGYRMMARIDASLPSADVILGDATAFTVTGTVRVPGGPVSAGFVVRAERISDFDGDSFFAVTDGAGSFAVTLPAAAGYVLTLDDPRLTPPEAVTTLRESVDRNLTLVGGMRAPAPDEVIAWIQETAVAIDGADPTHDLRDLESLDPIIGSARMVAVGEATHGTREFFQLKHRILEYLVERRGFTVFGIEASFPESITVDDYVLTGKGDAKKALWGMDFWTWDTEEVLDLIEWMRKWNADPKHSKKVKFLGFDMQAAQGAVARVLEYLGKVDTRAQKDAAVRLAPLNKGNEGTYAALPADKRAETSKAISALVDSFDENRRAWSSRTSPSAWAVARQNAVVVSQAEHQWSSPKDRSWRDESMAKNAQWILDQEPPGARAMLWAHNGHVTRRSTWTEPTMGAVLSRALGKDYVSFGFVFDRGAFQASSADDQGHWSIRGQSVGEVAPGDVAEAFHRSGKAMCALDLRNLPPGLVEEWWSAPHFMREAGSTFVDEGSTSIVVVLPHRYDAVIFVDQTTHSRLFSQPP